MKLTKKLLPALGMLALSACMLVTSTFAWFATNMNVKATGMTVTAKGEQIYLQIIKDSESFTPGADQSVAGATYTHNPDATPAVKIQLLPTSVRTAGEGSTLSAYTGATAPAWVSAVGKTNVDGSALNNAYENVTGDANAEGNNGKYFLKNSFYIRLDPTAGGLTSSALRVSSIDLATSIQDTTGKNFMKALSVLVVCTIDSGESAQVKGDIWNYNGTQFVHTAGSTQLSGDTFTVTDKSAKVDVYVYFDGDNGNCTLAKLAEVTGATYTVDVNFTVAAAQQNQNP